MSIKLDKNAIENLISTRSREGRVYEYKSQLPDFNARQGKGAKAKERFLSSFSSFFNGGDGHIIYGIEEELDEDGRSTGIPARVVGIDGNIDAAILQMGQMIQHNIQPTVPISYYDIYAVDGFEVGPVVVATLRRSPVGPHMLTTKSSPFYLRGNAGKIELDVLQIGELFANRQAVPEKLVEFRTNRLVNILSEHPMGELPEGVKMLVHIVPVETLLNAKAQGIPPEVPASRHSSMLMKPMTGSRYNFDGYVSFLKTEDGLLYRHVQFFNNGVLEFYDSVSLRFVAREDLLGQKLIPSVGYEHHLISDIPELFKLAQLLGYTPPYYLGVTLHDVDGYKMSDEGFPDYDVDSPGIERNTLVLPPILVEDPNQSSTEMLRPIFDAIWQAAGYSGSKNYDEMGQWSMKIQNRS